MDIPTNGKIYSRFQLRFQTEVSCKYYRSGKDRLRCFPSCCESGHITKGFCGRDIRGTLFLRKDIDIDSLLFVGEIVQISEYGATSRFFSDQEVNETDLRFRCLDEQESLCLGQLSSSPSNGETISGYAQYDISFAKKPWIISQEASDSSSLGKNGSYCFSITIFRAYTVAIDGTESPTPNNIKPIRLSKLSHIGRVDSSGFNVLSSFQMGQNKKDSALTASIDVQPIQRKTKSVTPKKKRSIDKGDTNIKVATNANPFTEKYKGDMNGQLNDSKTPTINMVHDQQQDKTGSQCKKRNLPLEINLSSYKISKQNSGQCSHSYEQGIQEFPTQFSCRSWTSQEDSDTQDFDELSSLPARQCHMCDLNSICLCSHEVSPLNTPIHRQEQFEYWENIHTESRSPLFHFTGDDYIPFQSIEDAITSFHD
jgi:hypothetical protein